MTIKGFIFLICLIVMQKSFAQLPKNITKITAYQQRVQMGNIPVDDGGKPMEIKADTTFSIFIETKSNTVPQWQKAYRNGMTYTLSLTDSTDKQRHELNTTVGQTLKADNGNRLWRYELVMDAKKPCANNTNSITLKGTYNGKKITILVKNIITLDPELRP